MLPIMVHCRYLCPLKMVCVVSPVCGAQAETPHLAWQGSVPVAAIMSIKPSWVVVLSMPSSVPMSKAVAVVGSGVSVIQVSGLRSERGQRLRGVRRFTDVVARTAGDGTEILQKRKRGRKACQKG